VTESRPYLRPGLFIKIANRFVTLFGVATTLAIRGRTSGEWRTTPVNVLEYQGSRYLVSPRGETQWVRNLRAAGEGELRRRGKTEPFAVAEEVPVERRPPLIDAYLAKWGNQVKSYFAELPDPADHPVFRIETR
jgi:deazaflavin-dependent oxidoreductase (nitroreductase family)